MLVQVRKGDSLWYYSQLFSVPLQILEDANKEGKCDNLPEGSTVKIPAYRKVTVNFQPGDTLWTIAASRKLHVDSLYLLNPHLQNVPQIEIGVAIQVPVRIESKLIYLDVEGSKKLFDTYPDLRIILFESYQMDFLKNFSDLEVSSEEIVQLLDSKVFEAKNKFELIKVMNQNLLIEDSKIASRSCDILASFEYYPLSFAQLEFMFKFNTNWESKIEMLIMHFNSLDFDEIQSLSKRLTPDGYYSKLFEKQKKPTFDKNAFNEAFFELLESKSFIRSFGISPWDKHKYRVIANY